MDRRQLEYFVAVADHRGFTSASQSLYIAQPSLSQAIKNLENELGVALFHRLRSGVRLTSAGEALLGPARQTLRDFETAVAAVTSVCDLRGGRLDVATLPVLGADPLAGYIGRFRAEHPGIMVRLADGGMAEPLDLIRSGDSEIAVTLGPVEASDLDVFTLVEDALQVVLPPDHEVEDGTPIDAEEISGLGLVVTSSTKPLLLRVLAEIGSRPSFTVETDHREALASLVLLGAAASIMPPGLAAQVGALGAVVRPITPTVMRQVVMAYRRVDLSPAARAFIRLVQEVREVDLPALPEAIPA